MPHVYGVECSSEYSCSCHSVLPANLEKWKSTKRIPAIQEKVVMPIAECRLHAEPTPMLVGSTKKMNESVVPSEARRACPLDKLGASSERSRRAESRNRLFAPPPELGNHDLGTAWNCADVRRHIFTSISITGTSISTPTTAASDAPEESPNSIVEVAIATSK